MKDQIDFTTGTDKDENTLPNSSSADAILVRALLDHTNPHHEPSWNSVSRLARSIIRKQLFNPVDDPSLDEEDLLQMALAEIASGLHRFKYNCQLNTWLYQIIINSLRRGYRDRNAQRRKGDTVPLSEDVVETHNTLAETVRLQGLVQEILRFLANQEDKRLVAIFYRGVIEEQRLIEIGQHLHLSPARVHALLDLARHLVRENPSIRGQAEEFGLQLELDNTMV